MELLDETLLDVLVHEPAPVPPFVLRMDIIPGHYRSMEENQIFLVLVCPFEWGGL